eukprot:10952621-Lingulodinium_polyedra.AAC.1
MPGPAGSGHQNAAQKGRGRAMAACRGRCGRLFNHPQTSGRPRRRRPGTPPGTWPGRRLRTL